MNLVTRDQQSTAPTNAFAAMLDEYLTPMPKRGEFIEGEVLSIGEDALFIDVGAKRDALVVHDEVNRLADDYLASLSAGDTVPLYVLRTPVGDEQLLVSLEKGLQQEDWDRAEEDIEKDIIQAATIIGHNKGGLVVQYGRLQGFVPNSHAPALRHLRDRQALSREKQKMVGEALKVKAIEVDRQRERLILSATAAQERVRAERMAELNEGDIVEGRVVKLVNYGAFIDLGGVDGLLHISNMSWQHIKHPKKLLEVGEIIEVKIEGIDRERERISLDRQSLMPSPFEAFAKEHVPNELISGKVVSITDFGAFVEVDDGVQGLVHISEIDMRGAEVIEQVLTVGDTVLTRILSIEPDRARLSLSMRQVTADEELIWMAETAE